MLTETNFWLDLRDAPKILNIIVTWNKKEYVLDLLDSLNNIIYPKEAIDILVVDNHSNDQTAEAILENYPHVNLIVNSTNLGGTGGFNTGLKWAFEQPEASYKYYWLLDNDVLVHQHALVELVKLLEEKKDAGVAGSTMMQLDYPWRINEMGAFLNRENGNLFLNMHEEEIRAWKDVKVEDLISYEADKIKSALNYPPFLEVEYVAAASLLIRADVARKAGLWMDFFIHYDDVEWCLRVAKMGYKIIVSSRSLIWHLSAVAKVLTWAHYYDNRNILYLLRAHGSCNKDLRRVIRFILKKTLYYSIIGKQDIAELHIDAIDDFIKGKLGKKDIRLSHKYRKNSEIVLLFQDPSIHNILIPWPVDLYKTGLFEKLKQVNKNRSDLQIDFLMAPGGSENSHEFVSGYIKTSKVQFFRLIKYWRLRKKYNLVLQSEYHLIIPLSFISPEILFINNDEFCRQTSPGIKTIFNFLKEIIKRWNVKIR